MAFRSRQISIRCLRNGLGLALAACWASSLASAQGSLFLYDFYTPEAIVSRDGSLVGGRASGGVLLSGSSYLIDAAGNIEILTTGNNAQLWALSADGSVRVERNALGGFIVDDGVATPMPLVGESYSPPRVTDISGDGQILTGIVANEALTALQPFIFDRTTSTYTLVTPSYDFGEVDIPLSFSTLEAISTDGTTLVGIGNDFFTPLAYDAIVTDASGIVTYLDTLDTSLGYTFSYASDVDRDGNVIVGTRTASADDPEPWRIEDGVFTLLGFEGRATAVTSNGYRVVGNACFDPPCGGWRTMEAFYWTPDTGRRRIAELLEDDYGFDLEGWTLLEVSNLSDDGLVMAGRSESAAGDLGTWVARLPRTIEVMVPEPGFPAAIALGALGLLGGGRVSDRQRGGRRET